MSSATSFVKICGLTTPEGVAAALAAGADAIGFVFAESVRRVDPARARELAAPARGRARCVAVTRHPEPALLERVVREFEPDVLQSDAADLEGVALSARIERLAVLRSGEPLPQPLPARVLFEGPVSGTGRTADWQAARALAARTQLVLAGGLHPGNVADAIRAVRPWGVDVSSGVEASPGVKSPERIHEFVRAARAAFEELQS